MIGYKVNDLYFTVKNKKLADLITFIESVYHDCESGYSLRLMIDSLRRDDIPLLSQWINKKGTFGRQKFLFCWQEQKDFFACGQSLSAALTAV